MTFRERITRVADVLRNEGADVAETIGSIAIFIAIPMFLVSLPWPWSILLLACVGVRLYRRAQATAELDRYRRGSR